MNIITAVGKPTGCSNLKQITKQITECLYNTITRTRQERWIIGSVSSRINAFCVCVDVIMNKRITPTMTLPGGSGGGFVYFKTTAFKRVYHH